MKLITKDILKGLPKLKETEDVPLEDKVVLVKIFNPYGAGVWYILEGEEQEEDVTFFGLVELQEKEFGYFTLSELESFLIAGRYGLERDLYFYPTKIGEL